MKNNKLLLLLFVLIVIITSCNKDKIDETDFPLEYRYVLMDTLGNEKTEFNQGENIILSFQVINKGSDYYLLRNFLHNYDFFRVYQINTNGDTLDYGKSYDGYCEVGGFGIPKNGKFEITCPWVNTENVYFYDCLSVIDATLHQTYLPIGNFYTNFEQLFIVPDLNTETEYFKINFTVK